MYPEHTMIESGRNRVGPIVRMILWILATVIALSGPWWLAFVLALGGIAIFSAFELVTIGVMLDMLYYDVSAESFIVHARFTLFACLTFLFASYVRAQLR